MKCGLAEVAFHLNDTDAKQCFWVVWEDSFFWRWKSHVGSDPMNIEAPDF